jgi:hypothetical protein
MSSAARVASARCHIGIGVIWSKTTKDWRAVCFICLALNFHFSIFCL